MSESTPPQLPPAVLPHSQPEFHAAEQPTKHGLLTRFTANGIGRALRSRRQNLVEPNSIDQFEEPGTEERLTDDPTRFFDEQLTDTITEPVELSASAQAFWEKGSVLRAKSFTEQMAELHADPTSRKNRIRVRPSAILPDGLGSLSHSKSLSTESFTEAEGLFNLERFLDKTEALAQTDTETQGEDIQERIENFRDQFSFLGEKEYVEACTGIAEMWYEYTSQGSDYVLNVFDEPEKQKSYTKVLNDIRARYATLAAWDENAGRVISQPAQWQATPHAKLVVVDDWMTSGNTVKNRAVMAVRQAEAVGKPEVAQNIEAHLLISTQGQTETELSIFDNKTVQVRSFLQTEHATENSIWRGTPSGFHSSVDYGFETPMVWLTDYCHDRGVDVEAPWLTQIDPPYSYTERTPAGTKILEAVAGINKTERELSDDEKRLRAELQVVSSIRDENEQRRDEIYVELAMVQERKTVSLKRRDELIDNYKQTKIR